ncbi:MAG: SGNH/GDSL hydrolase family protein [Acidobacteria bacterium]|nr:SGNH/GDSL hydrolase family protein [Acidobacteriota bacterium]
MKPAATLIAALALSLATLAGFLHGNPFQSAGHALDWLFGAPPAWTQVEHTVQSAEFQEISRGERPLGSLRQLEAGWQRRTGARRVVLIGNSQMLSVSLAAGEPPPQGPEPTYSDLLSRELAARSRNPVLCYRLAAPGMSYTEALWYVLYLSGRPHLRPDAVAIQLNYQSFWNGGVRAGMQELLADEDFRARVEQEAQGQEAYAESFREALAEYRQRSTRVAAGPKPSSPGDALESHVRQVAAQWPPLSRKYAHRDGLLETLYRARVYVLGLKPTTARSITGPRMRRSQASLEAIARLCRAQGTALILFQAPLNPQVDLYRTAEDKSRHEEFLARLQQISGSPLLDWERSIPAPQWGKWMNGPDPLHLSRAGHRSMADRMIRAIDDALRLNAPGSGHGI